MLEPEADNGLYPVLECAFHKCGALEREKKCSRERRARKDDPIIAPSAFYEPTLDLAYVCLEYRAVKEKERYKVTIDVGL